MRWPWQREKGPAKQVAAGETGAKRKPHATQSNRDEHGRWLPGVSGNPDGPPPKDKRISEAVRALGEQELTPGTGWTRNHLLAALYWSQALLGDPHAMDAVAERSDGKVPVVTQLSGPGGGPIEMKQTPEYSEDELRKWEEIQLAKAAAESGSTGA
jgi:hypothetical protein